MSYPSLTNLPLCPRPRNELTENASDGLYCLDAPNSTELCNSSIILFRRALQPSDAQTQELDDFMSNEDFVSTTPNKMGGLEKNPDGSYAQPNEDERTPAWKVQRDCNGHPTGRMWKSAVLRKQATFGAQYNFGQVNSCIMDRNRWPELVTQCLAVAKQLASERGVSPDLYNGVHVNLYPSGNAGVQPHSDDESAMVKGLPIFSFTVLNGDREPRPFSIYTASKGKPEKVAGVKLGHGDLLIMQGDMQSYFLHGIEKCGARRYQNARRLNLTVRAFAS